MSQASSTPAQLTQPQPVLDPKKVRKTIDRLHRRIEERFPGSGLGRVCGTLHEIGKQTEVRVAQVETPDWWIRAVAYLTTAFVLAGVGTALWAFATVGLRIDDAGDLLDVFQSALQDAIYVGLAVIFLLTIENRRKRRRALGFIRELRDLAHVVDMHQLTKDPHSLLQPAAATASSPERHYDRVLLGRYLDYCSEMLSLISKVAALYSARLDDDVVLQAVDEVEAITTGLSRKIWQKIMILNVAKPT